MPVTQEEIGRRLRAAREACRMTQEQVAEALGVSRATVAQLELGNRGVSGLELDRLAHLYGRDIREFLADAFQEEDPVAALFRAERDMPQASKVTARLRECVALRRALSELEARLGAGRQILSPARYPWPSPNTRWEAVQQGERAAYEERKRLDLGAGPAPDLVDLFDGEGIRCAALKMPGDVSGVTIFDEDGPFVVVNEGHPVPRRRFSFAHEFAHVLLDRDGHGAVSRSSNRSELFEVRANAFAAAFLMPEEGVRAVVASLGKGQPSRASTEVYDGSEAIRVEGRAVPGSQDIQLYDVAQIAAHFRVSREACIYRLKSLKLLTEPEAATLREADRSKGKALAEQLGLPEPDHALEREWFRRRFLALILEAYRREVVSRRKLVELASLVQLKGRHLDKLLADAGLGDQEPAEPLLPAD